MSVKSNKILKLLDDYIWLMNNQNKPIRALTLTKDQKDEMDKEESKIMHGRTFDQYKGYPVEVDGS